MVDVFQKAADWIEEHDIVRDFIEFDNKSFIKNMKPGGGGWSAVLDDQEQFKKDQGADNTVIDWIMNNWQLGIIGIVALLVLLRD